MNYKTWSTRLRRKVNVYQSVMSKKKSKKYRVIAKVKDSGEYKFVKYKVNNLRLFALFLDRNFQDWYYFNVYQYVKDGKGNQLASFTKNSRPTSGHVY